MCGQVESEFAVVVLAERSLSRELLRIYHLVLIGFERQEREFINEGAVVYQKVFVLAEIDHDPGRLCLVHKRGISFTLFYSSLSI